MMRLTRSFACLILYMVSLMKHCEEDGVDANDVDLANPLLRSISFRGPTDHHNATSTRGDMSTTIEQSGDSAQSAGEESLPSDSELGAVGITTALTPDAKTSFERGKFSDDDHRSLVESSQSGTSKTRKIRGQRPGRMLCPTCRHGRPPPPSTAFPPESVVAKCGRCQSYYDIDQANDAATASPDGIDTDEKAISSTSGIV